MLLFVLAILCSLVLMNPASRQVARYIQSVSDAGDNPKLQETLEALKPYACLGA